MSDYEAVKNVPNGSVWPLDFPIVLLSAVALLLVGPLQGAFEAHPLVLFASTLFLFMIPGVLLTYWFLGEYFSGAALVPVSFVIGPSLFGLLGVPLLVLHLSLDIYMWVVGAVLAAFLTVAMFRAARRRAPARRENDAPAASASSRWLWAPFLGLSVTLAFVSYSRVPGFYEDIWVYLAYVREFLSTDALASHEPYFGNEIGLSRVQINGWLLEQAALSKISGIDPVKLVFSFLAPTLVVMALLAFYALARVLFKSEAAALLAGCLCALFFLVNLNHTHFSFGGEFVGRIAEDKFVARFLFLPISLAFAVAFVEGRRWRYLAAFAFICWSVVAVHPVGLAIVGLSVGGVGLVYMAVNWRRREAWTKMVSLGVALLSILFVPALYVLATGNPLTAVLSDADINSHDPDVLANMVFVRPGWKHVYELEDGSYIMHPSVILNPVMLGAFLLGIPFLVRRVKASLAAQLLLGVLLLSTVVCFVPPIATFVGDRIVLPGQLWRLAWPVPLAALLIVGWMAWEAVGRGEARLKRLGVGRRIAAHLLPLVLLTAMVAVAAPSAMVGARDVHPTDQEIEQRPSFVFDPIFGWMRTHITEPSVVLAPDEENTCIPAYSARANVVSLRGASILNRLSALEQRAPGQIEAPRRALDVRKFYRASTLKEKVEILRRYEVDYVLVHANSSIGEQLKDLPGVTMIDTPGERYRFYAVDHRRLEEHLD